MQKHPGAGWLFACVVIVLLATFAVQPVLDGGINDDWCFARMAQRFASNGHVTYDGWTEPLALPTTLLGGTLIRLFGFSYLVLRMSVIPFWVGVAVLIWLIGRRLASRPLWHLWPA